MVRGVRLEVSVTEVEIVSDVLWSLGVAAITEDWTSDDVVVLRTSFGSDDDKIAELMSKHLPDVMWCDEEIDSEVAETWKKFARPTRIDDRLYIRPSWDVSSLAPDAIVVSIDPGATFGMGDHPTTRGCLALLADSVEPGESVLDVGCGSGVLGICSLVLGAESAHGIDIATASLETSRANAERNGVSDRWQVSLDSLASVARSFDTVVANILAPVLIDLAIDLVRVARHRIIISGLLDTREGPVVDVLAPFVERRRTVVDGWVTIELVRPG